MRRGLGRAEQSLQRLDLAAEVVARRGVIRDQQRLDQAERLGAPLHLLRFACA